MTTEHSAALSVKARTGQMTADDRSRALGAFQLIAHTSFEVPPVLRDDFLVAARFAD